MYCPSGIWVCARVTSSSEDFKSFRIRTSWKEQADDGAPTGRLQLGISGVLWTLCYRQTDEDSAVCRTLMCHQRVIPSQKEFLTFSPFRIDNNTLDGTDLDALWNLKVSNTLGTVTRFDFVNFFALVDGVIGALRLANIAIDAFICDYQCHKKYLNTKRTRDTD